jgi:uncharacterized protein YjaZ
MDSIKLLVANSSGGLTSQLDKIGRAFQRAVAVVSAKLALTLVDVVCVNDPLSVIPELGIGGYTPSRHLVYLYLDSLKELDENEIFATLCHELHHARRYDGPGIGQTLFDSFIFEGLATAFEEAVSEGGTYLSTMLQQRSKTPKLIKETNKYFDDKDFDHRTWFLTDKTKKLPSLAGYEIGFYIVRNYLALNNQTAANLVLAPPDIFHKFFLDTMK